MTTATKQTAQSAIEYPDDDGEPMSDNTLQFDWMTLVKGYLEAIFLDNPNVFVAGNLLWYPVEGKPTIRSAPDVMVAFGRPKERRGSYKQWVEGNVAPQVTFEILSPGNQRDEMDRKFEFYETFGVEEYYVYDPDDGSLAGWLRKGNHLEKVADMAGFVSPWLNIRFEPGEGPNSLQIIGPDGESFQTHAQDIQQRRAAERRAEAERQRADNERQLKEAERQRADNERQLKEAERQRADDERKLKEVERQRADSERRLKEAERQRADDERKLRDAEQDRAERYAAKLRELGIEPD
jgi:Uma2 family endonuclease